MALAVEVIGAPGAGKSALVGAADGHRLGDGRVVRDARAVLRSRRVPGPLGALPGLADWTRDPSPAARTAALLRRADDWAPFLRFCADLPPDPRTEPLLRLSRIDWLLRSLELAALAAEHGSDGRPQVFALLDEGPAQRALGTPDPAAFAAVVPAPAAVVLVRTDRSVLRDRLARRAAAGGAILRHRHLDPEESAEQSVRDAELLTVVAEGLAARSVPLLRLDGGAPVSELVPRLGRWLASLPT